jgi:hypothetical protein
MVDTKAYTYEATRPKSDWIEERIVAHDRSNPRIRSMLSEFRIAVQDEERERLNRKAREAVEQEWDGNR